MFVNWCSYPLGYTLTRSVVVGDSFVSKVFVDTVDFLLLSEKVRCNVSVCLTV